MELYSSVSFCSACCTFSTGFSSKSFSLATTSRFFAKLLCSVFLVPALALLRASKNLLQASRKSFQSSSPCLRGTTPTVFHSFCSAIILSPVFFQSVLSASSCAFLTSSCFFSKLLEYCDFSSLKNAAFLLKNTSLMVRKRSKIFTFIF